MSEDELRMAQDSGLEGMEILHPLWHESHSEAIVEQPIVWECPS
jgi:hypothetical protein